MKRILSKSRYLEIIPLQNGNFLCVNGVANKKNVFKKDVVSFVDFFSEPRPMSEVLESVKLPEKQLNAFVDNLVAGGLLYEGTPEEEKAYYEKTLSSFFGRDPNQTLSAWNAKSVEGHTNAYWAITAGKGLDDMASLPHKASAVIFGACDVQMETDFLREEARKYGVDLTVLSTFVKDISLLSDRPCDVVIVGALDSRFKEFTDSPGAYVEEARNLLASIRKISQAPVLLNNLPVPTTGPGGWAETAPSSMRTHFQQLNLQLAALAGEFSDVFIVDVDGFFSLFGKKGLLDDAVTGFDHLGSLRWLEQRSKSEMRATHDMFPPLKQLDSFRPLETYQYERLLAQAHMSMIVSVLGIEKKSCVIFGLDNTLWPGELAKTKKPFAWSREVSGDFSFIGYYFGLHEAAKCLARRGIKLACVGTGDEKAVVDFWKYPDFYPTERLLTMKDFSGHRINGSDVVENVKNIAKELNVPLGSVVFVDGNAATRDKVSKALKDVTILGENQLSLRWDLLTMPQLQTRQSLAPQSPAPQSQTAGASKAKIEQVKPVAVAVSKSLSALDIKCTVKKHVTLEDLSRMHDLVVTSNQFNTTGKVYSKEEFEALMKNPKNRVYSLSVRDRLTNYGLVGVCVVEGNVISAFLINCKVIGLGVENVFLRTVVSDFPPETAVVEGLYVATAKNVSARNIFSSNGFKDLGGGRFSLDLKAEASASAVSGPYTVERQNLRAA